MKRKCIFLFAIVFTICCLSSCQEKDICVDVENSFYSAFEVENDKVYIYCTLNIENPYKEDKTVEIIGLFDNDAKNGLLTEGVLEGYSIDCKSKLFNLRCGDNWIEVVFIGEYAGNPQKYDRTLPAIQINEP